MMNADAQVLYSGLPQEEWESKPKTPRALSTGPKPPNPPAKASRRSCLAIFVFLSFTIVCLFMLFLLGLGLYQHQTEGTNFGVLGWFQGKNESFNAVDYETDVILLSTQDPKINEEETVTDEMYDELMITDIYPAENQNETKITSSIAAVNEPIKKNTISTAQNMMKSTTPTTTTTTSTTTAPTTTTTTTTAPTTTTTTTTPSTTTTSTTSTTTTTAPPIPTTLPKATVTSTTEVPKRTPFVPTLPSTTSVEAEAAEGEAAETDQRTPDSEYPSEEFPQLTPSLHQTSDLNSTSPTGGEYYIAEESGNQVARNETDWDKFVKSITDESTLQVVGIASGIILIGLSLLSFAVVCIVSKSRRTKRRRQNMDRGVSDCQEKIILITDDGSEDEYVHAA